MKAKLLLLDLARNAAGKPSSPLFRLHIVLLPSALLVLFASLVRYVASAGIHSLLGAFCASVSHSLLQLCPLAIPLWLCVLSLLLFVYAFHELHWKRRLLPPGPVPWLCAGNMPQAFFHGVSNIDALLQRWRVQYGGVFTFWMGPIPMVMVSDVALLRRYFVRHGDAFAGRWQNFVTHTFMDGHNGVVQIQGPKWREQRRFSLHILRDFGLGRQLMEQKINCEVRELVAHLDTLLAKTPTGYWSGPLDVCKPSAVCVANIIDSILFGRTYAYDDAQFIRVQQMLDRQSALVVRPVFGLYLAVPFTTRVPILNGAWRQLLAIRHDFWAFLEQHIQEHREHFVPDSPPADFTFAYMQEMHRRKAEGGGQMGHFSDKQLKMLLLDLFFAGSETTVTTVKWGILLLIGHPEVQRKCAQEMARKLHDREAQLGDRTQLPFLCATICEIQRMANILPINLLRTCEDDFQLDGFHFARGTMVLPQISITMNDPAYFPEPDRFRPERFLDGQSGTLLRVDAFVPFSVGKRQCLGESLARAELFLIFAALIRHFEFRAEDDQRPSLRRIYGLTCAPLPYKCRVRRRTPETGPKTKNT